jgi:arsenate reductase
MDKKVNTTQKKKRILFICTHNAVRSQMAEAFVNSLYSDRYEAQSAGTEPTSVNPYAIEVMNEIGIDISTQISKSIAEFQNATFDTVVTVCSKAKETCPFFPGAQNLIHKDFANPEEFTGTEEEILTLFRKLRDDIKIWLDEILSKTESV